MLSTAAAAAAAGRGRLKVGRRRLKSDSIRDLARSRKVWIVLGTRILLSDVSSAVVVVVVELAGVLPTSFGFRLMFSVREETKIGVRPGMPTGNRGGVMLAVEGAGVVAASGSSSSSLAVPLPLVLNLARFCLCLSFSLALKGFGRLRLRPGIMEGLVGSLATSEEEVGLMLLLRADDLLGLMLLLPLMLLLARLNTLLDPPNDGLD